MTKDEIQKNSEHWYNKYKDAEKRIAGIKANCDLAIEGRDIKIKELEQQIEKMKCCENCKFKGCDKSNSYQTCWYCTNKDKWKLGR